MNTTATGGYLAPSPEFPAVPAGQSFTDFLQGIFEGISGLKGDLVRPRWQINPPPQPDIHTNWMAFGVLENNADANAYSALKPDGHGGQVNITQRMTELPIQCAFYGPDSMEIMEVTRDGFQIDANRAGMKSGGLNFVGTDRGHRIPEKINERWYDKWEMGFVFNRQILRSYPILTFTSVSGIIEGIVGGNLKTVDWKANV